MADIYPESRVEEILVAMINGEEYTKFPESRIEALLIELLGKIIEVEGRGAYEFKGSVDFDELPETLTPDMAGWTYNMAESFITDNRFVDGVGKVYPQGTNVSIANVGTDEDPDMMFDVPSAFVDVSAIYASINKVIADIAPEFSIESPYHENDLVIYNEILYIFTTDHAAGEFNPLEVEQTDISTLLASVHNEIDLLDQTISGISESIPTDLSDLTEDATHRTVTDTEKSEWSGKQSNVNLTLTQDAVVSDRDVTDGSGNTLSVVADSVSVVKTATGNPVIVEDALESNADSLVAQIVPIQDLHGYDHPWVGGAGKNKCYDSLAGFVAITDGVGEYNANASVTSLVFNCIANTTYTVSGLTGKNRCVWGVFDSIPTQGDTTSYCANAGDTTNTFTPTKTGVCVLYVGNSVLDTSHAQVEEGSTATSFAPYSNVCPISGRTAVNVMRSDVNILDASENEEGGIDASGNLASGNQFRRSSVYIPVLGGLTYTLSSKNDITVRLYFYDSNNTFISPRYEGRKTVTAQAPINAAYAKWSIYNNGATITEEYTLGCELMLEIGSNASAYKPYVQPLLITIALGTTVYGGTLDVKTGVLTVTWAAVDMGDISWNYYATKQYFYAAFAGYGASKPASGVLPNLISSCYKTVNTSNDTNIMDGKDSAISYYVPSNAFQVVVKDTRYTDASALATALSGQTICYELATPTTVQLTGEQLQMLMGYNRVTSDSGELTLTYKANAVQNLQTDKADNADMVDYIENGNKASRAYSANQFMLWKGDLYKVTTSIASGATITAGTNVTKTTIGAVLTALLNA